MNLVASGEADAGSGFRLSEALDEVDATEKARSRTESEGPREREREERSIFKRMI